MSTVGLSRQIVQMVQFYERRKVQILCLSFFYVWRVRAPGVYYMDPIYRRECKSQNGSTPALFFALMKRLYLSFLIN